MRQAAAIPRNVIVRALALALAVPLTPVGAAIVTLGPDVTPIPPSGTVSGYLNIGATTSGSVAVNGGSVLTADALSLAGSAATATGSLSVSGAGSRTVITFANGGNLDLGGSGTGDISLLAGGQLQYGGTGTACMLNCRLFVSNASGSNGSMLVSGAGSSFSTLGGVVVGQGTLLRVAAGDAIDYGQVGGSSSGTVRVEAGGTVNSSFITVGQLGGGTAARNGSESSVGTLVLDGMASAWNAVRNAAQTGGRSLLSMASGRNTTGNVTVRNGAVMVLDGSSAPGEFSGINAAAIANAATTSNANAVITVTGAGSRLQVDGGVGFLNLGRGFGTQGTLTVADGAFLGGSGGPERGLVYGSVGVGGGTGTATITGARSLLQFSGRNSSNNSDPNNTVDGGAFLSVGRTNSGAAGQGTMNITTGGRMVIDTQGLALTNPDGQTGMYIGFGTGSNGTLNISGTGSRVDILAGSGGTPYAAVGRDGATGNLMISGGGVLMVNSSHTSVPNPGPSGYLPADGLFFEIGRRVGAAGATPSVGTATVTGAGSQLVLGGNADAFVTMGRGTDATGSLNITNGGLVHANAMLVGQDAGASGTLTMNAGQLILSGQLNGGSNPGQGGGLSVGRNGGTGVANIGNGSVVTISSNLPRASLSAGGTIAVPGGTGLINVTGGSTVTVTGPEALVGIGRTASATDAGVGVLNLQGAGSSVTATGIQARLLVAGGANTIGTVNVGIGSTLSSSDLIGVAHDGTASTAGIGTLILNGIANAASLMNGSNGTISGSGVINANVTNLGVINPGNSPGRLTINGALDNSAGKILLEVQQLANGLFSTDEIVLGDPSLLTLGAGAIEFQFLAGTDVTAFQAAGIFAISSFFKELDGNGTVVGLAPARLSLFANTQYTASAANYNFTSFSFNPISGATFTGNPVPTPTTLSMAVLALSLLSASCKVQARRRA